MLASVILALFLVYFLFYSVSSVTYTMNARYEHLTQSEKQKSKQSPKQCDCSQVNTNLNNLKTTVNLISSQVNTLETQVTANTQQLTRLAQAEAQLNDFVTKGAADLNIDPKHLNSDTT